MFTFKVVMAASCAIHAIAKNLNVTMVNEANQYAHEQLDGLKSRGKFTGECADK